MMTKICFLLSLLCFALTAQGQSPDTSAAATYIRKAERALAQENWGATYQNYDAAAQVYKEAQAWERYIDLTLDAALFALEVGEVRVGLKDLETLAQKSQSASFEPSPNLALAYHKLGVANYRVGAIATAREAFLQAAKMREQLREVPHTELAKSYYNAGYMSGFLTEYETAIRLLKKALRFSQVAEDPVGIAEACAELGRIYTRLGDFNRSLGYLNTAENALKGIEERQNRLRGIIQSNKGENFLRTKNFAEAINAFRRARNTFQSLKQYQNQYSVLNNMAIAYMRQEDYEKASELYEQAFQLAKKQLSNRPNLTSKTLLNKAVLQKELGNLAKAKQYWKDAYEPALARFGKAYHPQLYNFYQTLHGIYYHENKYDSALIAHQKELRCLIPQYSTQDPYTLPLQQNLESVQNLNFVLDALALKARTLRARYQKSKDSKDLRSAIAHIELFHQTMLMARERYSEGSDLIESTRSVTAYEIGIGAAMDWYAVEPKEKHLATAFDLAERNKSLQLLETLKNRKAENLLPTEVQKQEQQLQDSLTQQRKLLFTWRQENQAEPLLDSLNQAIFETQRSYKRFIQQLEREYPKYHNQKYAIRTAKLEQVQEALGAEQALVEYFLGDSSLYIFRIEKQSIQVEQRRTQQLNLMEDVETLRESISKYYLNINRSDAVFRQTAGQYVAIAHQLYEQLFAPIAEELPQRLVLITHGPLSALPFDALLEEQPERANQFKQHAYLLRRHAISQNYSATLWLEMQRQERPKAPKDFIAYAPSFEEDSYSVMRGERFKLSPLAYNKTEVQGIQELLGQGQIVTDSAATEAHFKAHASQYRIVHCATHGMANDDAPDYSLLAFTEIEDSLENEFLYVGELENMELKAELVVLSACETAVGRLYRGEGVASLARGFAAAGAQSLVTTLWSVSDRSTYEIMQHFYRGLKAGKPKDIALQEAKLQFIEEGSNSMTVHPFMWGPFLSIGDAEPIELEADTNWTLWFGVALASLFLLAFAWSFSRRKQ